MLLVTLAATELYPEVDVKLEHSLVSLSKWESLHKKAFFGKEPKTQEEMLSYIDQMVLNDKLPFTFSKEIDDDTLVGIGEYINDSMTATWFAESGQGKNSGEIVTNELIYYWMISFQIPFTCETWHLSRLMTLINVCGVKQSKPKKMSKSEQAEQMRKLNAQRREAMGSSG